MTGALLIAGCGSDGGDGGETGTPAGGETVSVDMRDIVYVPKNLVVSPGTTVRWTNSDDLIHTVTKTSGPGPAFDSGDVMPGSTYEQKFEEPGRVDYVCTLHHGQRGSVTVRG